MVYDSVFDIVLLSNSERIIVVVSRNKTTVIRVIVLLFDGWTNDSCVRGKIIFSSNSDEQALLFSL